MARRAEREMVADDIAHDERPHRGRDFTVPHGELGGRVIGQRIGAVLRFQQQRECRVAADVDPFDRIHLDGDIQAHGDVPAGEARNVYAIFALAATAARGRPVVISAWHRTH